MVLNVTTRLRFFYYVQTTERTVIFDLIAPPPLLFPFVFSAILLFTIVFFILSPLCHSMSVPIGEAPSLGARCSRWKSA